MIDGKYADYKGETYKVVEIISQEVVLVTEDNHAVEHGFEAQTTHHSNHTLYFKQVPRTDLDELYELFQEARYENQYLISIKIQRAIIISAQKMKIKQVHLV